MIAEMPFIGFDQAHLTDGRSRLQLVDMRRTLFPAKAQDSFSNGARTHEDDLVAHLLQFRNLGCPAFDGLNVETATVVGDERAADLDDDPVRVLEK